MSPNHIIVAGIGRHVPTTSRRAAPGTGGSDVVRAARAMRRPTDATGAPASHPFILVTQLAPGVVGAVSRVGDSVVAIVSDRVPAGRVGTVARHLERHVRDSAVGGCSRDGCLYARNLVPSGADG